MLFGANVNPTLFRTLLPEALLSAPPPVMMSSTPTNQSANHLPEHLHHPLHHLVLLHTHQSWVSGHGWKID